VQRVERNMDRAVKRSHARPAYGYQWWLGRSQVEVGGPLVIFQSLSAGSSSKQNTLAWIQISKIPPPMHSRTAKGWAKATPRDAMTAAPL
jgi:hypothetical protein